MRDYYSDLADSDVATRHPTLFEARARYEPAKVRTQLRAESDFSAEHVVRYVVFPLDARWIYYEPRGKLLNEKRLELWRSLGGNEFLVTVPQARRASESVPLCATSLFDLHLFDRGAVAFPAVVEDAPDEGGLFSAPSRTHANLEPVAWAAIASALGLEGDLQSEVARALSRRLLRVCLALCHSPAYQADHADSLAQDFAHVPVPADETLFDRVADAGDDIAVLLNPLADARDVVRRLLGGAAAHLGVPTGRSGGQVAEGLWTVTVPYYGAAKGRWISRDPERGEPARAEWGAATGDLWISDEVYFQNVPERVWSYRLGGYPVLKKWLGYRDAKRARGRELTLDEVRHFQSMVQRIAAMLVLHRHLDELYLAAVSNPVRLACGP